MNERIVIGEGKHKVWLERSQAGEDIILVVGGGERPHIGGVVMKVPGEEIRVMNIGTHKDFHLLIPLAEKVSEKDDVTVVATGGVHVDDATKEDIQKIVENCAELAQKI